MNKFCVVRDLILIDKMKLQPHTSCINHMQLVNDILATASDDKTIQFFKADTLEHIKTVTGHTDWVLYLQFTIQNDLVHLVSASADKSIIIWNPFSLSSQEPAQIKQILNGHKKKVVTLQWDEEKIISGSYDKSIKIWDTQTGQCLRTITGHRGTVLSLEYQQDRLITGSADYTAKMWSISAGTCIRTYSGHEGLVYCVRAQDNHLITASNDHTIRVFDIDSGNTLQILSEHKDGVMSLFFYDNLMVSCSYDNSVRIWGKNEERYSQKQVINVHNCAIYDVVLFERNQVISVDVEGFIIKSIIA
jgi:WD40 repeat protein